MSHENDGQHDQYRLIVKRSRNNRPFKRYFVYLADAEQHLANEPAETEHGPIVFARIDRRPVGRWQPIK